MKSVAKAHAALRCAALICVFAIVAAFQPLTWADAQSLSFSYSFGASSSTGQNPVSAPIQDSQGFLVGTTEYGGSHGTGVAYAFDPSTNTMSFQSSFGATTGTGGVYPVGPIVQASSSTWYGTTRAGGTDNAGIVYRMNNVGSLFVLYSFGTNTNDGIFPYSGLIVGSDGALYGTTLEGGSHTYYGTIFKVTTSGTETVLHSFAAGTSDGSYPSYGLILDSNGDYYGTTEYGGAENDGVVYQMTPSGTVTILHSFGDGSVTNDGVNPMCSLIQDSSGNLYGTTTGGGAYGQGTVFEITTSGTVTILYSFHGGVTGDGGDPIGPVVWGPDGYLWGTTFDGGFGLLGSGNGVGTVFYVESSGTEFRDYTFSSLGGTTNQGFSPSGGLVYTSAGSLYGTAFSGGNFGYGSLFELTSFAGAASAAAGSVGLNGPMPKTADYESAIFSKLISLTGNGVAGDGPKGSVKSVASPGRA